MTWREAVIHCVEHECAADAAECALAALDTTEQYTVLLRLLLDEARDVARRKVLKIERGTTTTRSEIKQSLRHELGLTDNTSHVQILAAALESFKTSVRIEWTSELLKSSFALRNGTRVTWGEATLDEHQQRLDHLTDMSERVFEAAARHALAIERILAHGSTCLNEVLEAA